MFLPCLPVQEGKKKKRSNSNVSYEKRPDGNSGWPKKLITEVQNAEVTVFAWCFYVKAFIILQQSPAILEVVLRCA